MDYEKLVNLKEKVAIVTGGASGIGLATVKILQNIGCNVVILDIDKEKGEVETKKLNEKKNNVTFYVSDVTNSESCKKAIKVVREKYGRLDVLFNNAGVIRRKNVVEHGEDDWDLVLDVSLKSVFLLSKYAIPLMTENGGGSIINTGSGWGVKGGDDAASYCAAKAGVVNLSRAMAIDHGKDNIRVNSISPGDTDTALLRGEAEQLKLNEAEFLESSGSDRPLRRIGTPEDIAKGVLYLASDLSSWVTGTNLIVDGGGLA